MFIPKNLEKYLLIIILLINLSNSENHLHSSIMSLQDIFSTEKIIFNNLEKFIKESELKITTLKKFINDRDSISNSNHLNSTAIPDNPLDNIIGLRKFLKKSVLIEKLLTTLPYTDLNNFKKFKYEHAYPTDDDLDEIIKSIVRLQEVYDLTIHDIVQDYEMKFSSSDFFEIGNRMHKLNEDKFATKWFTQSLKKKKKENIKFREAIDKITILDYLATSKWREGGLINSKKAIKIAKEILQINPNDKNIKEKIKLFKNPYIRNDKTKTAEDKRRIKLYYKGCRGELNKADEEIRQLYCKYLTENNPFLKLARVKYEELNKNPLVILFHNVISDREIKRLKDLAKGNLSRAKVWNHDAGKEEKTEIRTSAFAWLDLNDDKIVSTIIRRIQDLTNLSLKAYEKLQIASYGMGGHYELHHDYHYNPPNDKIIKYFGSELGNRMGTLMFYLSDVERGGATVFPSMNLTISPQKGAAMFWYNLHANGEPDVRTIHAACPVIKGNKWVANQWIHEREQEFRRPCELNW